MTTDELIEALERMKSETDSLADSSFCLGCGQSITAACMGARLFGRRLTA